MRYKLGFLIAWLFCFNILFAQDTSKVFQNAENVNLVKEEYDRSKDERYKTKLLPSLIVPGIMIGYGLTTIKNNGIYSSYSAQRDIKKAFPNFNNKLDDIMIFAPYAEILALNLLKIKCKNDWLNTGLLFLKSELIMAAIVFPMKELIGLPRPYAQDSIRAAEAAGIKVDLKNYRRTHPNAFVSLPSGHTAQAFVAASIVHKEYRSKSNWYGVGAYAIATTVAAFRMLNNKHWQSDVIVGAGIGIMSVHIAYATHQFKWGRKEICFMPSYNSNFKGFAMAYSF